MNRSRIPIVLLLIVSLLAAGLTQHWAQVQRSSGRGATQRTGSADLSRMNSYALALLLGGLRGPLVMFLWPSAEEQKNQKNLEDFDTKIEWIRLLQAEFDTVHLFQIWNKAYNISVQMANFANKYRTILDALDYAFSVDAERPNNINIVYEIGRVYAEKLGGSAEKAYYIERVRDESQSRLPLVRVTFPPERRDEFSMLALEAGLRRRKLTFGTEAATGKLSITIPKQLADAIVEKFKGPDIAVADRPRIVRDRKDPAWRRTELDAMLDVAGNILPQYLAVTSPRPADLPSESPWNDGSELQYLKKYEPFPYGISPVALGYDYYKQAQVIQTVHQQIHTQVSDLVVDSRPALALKGWSEEEWERGRRAELEAFGKPTPAERIEMELPTAGITLDTPIVLRPPLTEGLYNYAISARLADDAVAEYERHLKDYLINTTTYLGHIDWLRQQAALARGDHDFIVAMTDPSQRTAMIASATSHYRDALRRTQIILLQYYTPDQVAQQILPQGVTRATVATSNLTDQQLTEMVAKVRALVPSDPTPYESSEEYREYNTYLQRIDQRLQTLGG